MSDPRESWLDLVSKMFWAVRESAPLHELPLGTVDHLGEGRKHVNGPWSGAECRTVLAPWHEVGWINLVADVEPPWTLNSAECRSRSSQDGAFLVLAREDSAELLNDSSRWRLGTADGHAMLCATDEGEAHEYSEWLALADEASREQS